MIILKSNGTNKDTYINHAKQHKWWQPDVSGKTNTEVLKELQNRPICPQCETLAMRHRDRNNMKCPKCGYEGRITCTLDEMMTKELYK